jgi:hypothetical protein
VYDLVLELNILRREHALRHLDQPVARQPPFVRRAVHRKVHQVHRRRPRRQQARQQDRAGGEGEQEDALRGSTPGGREW